MVIDILRSALIGVSADKAKEIIEEFFRNDKIIINVAAWEHKYNYLVLKFNIWNDRKSVPITSIYLKDNNKKYFPLEEPILSSEQFIFLDPSFLERSLSEYEHYYSQPFLIDENPKSYSVVFFIPDIQKLDFTELVIKNNKEKIFKINELISDSPTIKEYVENRGHCIEEYYQIEDIDL